MGIFASIRDAVTGLAASVEARRQTPTGNALNVQIGPGDPISNIPVVMDFEHHQVHEGETFKASDVQLSLGTTTVKYAIVVPAYADLIHTPHMVVEADVYNGAVLVQLYEAATFTGGAPLTALNRNRNSAEAPGAAITGGVTSTNGALLDSFFTGGGSKTAGNNRQASEWLLKANTTYRVDIVGLIVNTEAIVSFNWYEDLGV